MKKLITYDEKELTTTLQSMSAYLADIYFWVQMMKEQHEGKRENIDMSVSKDLMPIVNKLKDCIKSFDIKTIR